MSNVHGDLIQTIGEPVSIFYEPRNGREHSWVVSLVRVPMIHEHFPSILAGLRWLAENKPLFPEWEKQIEKAEKAWKVTS